MRMETKAALGWWLTLACCCAGCDSADRPATPPTTAQSGASASPEGETPGHSGAGWWCDSHGVPEEECSLCNSQAAAEFKKKNDWCKEHDRAESQCFLCDPKRQEKYAAMFRAKFGKEPPAVSAEHKKS